MLVVRDDELTVRDDDDALLEVARRRARVGEFQKPRGWASRANQQAGSSLPAFLVTAGTKR